MTGEHLIAEWIGNILGYDADTTYNTFKFNGDYKEGETRYYGGHRNSKIPVLCQSCNSEWSSQIQNQTRDFLKPILDGDRWRISMKERERFATWMSLFIVVRQLLHPELAALHAKDRLSFYRSSSKPSTKEKSKKATRPLNGYPIPGINVWISKFDGDTANFASHYRGLQMVSTKKGDPAAVGMEMNTYISTVAFGEIILVAFGSTLPSMHMCSMPIQATNGYLRHIGMQQVWPNYGNYDSEPQGIFGDADFTALIERITEMIRYGMEGERLINTPRLFIEYYF